MTREISSSLAGFDDLPDSAHVDVTTVASLRGCSVPSVWRHARLGLLPKPHRVGLRMARWNVGELRAAGIIGGESK